MTDEVQASSNHPRTIHKVWKIIQAVDDETTYKECKKQHRKPTNNAKRNRNYNCIKKSENNVKNITQIVNGELG